MVVEKRLGNKMWMEKWEKNMGNQDEGRRKKAFVWMEFGEAYGDSNIAASAKKGAEWLGLAWFRFATCPTFSTNNRLIHQSETTLAPPSTGILWRHLTSWEKNCILTLVCVEAAAMLSYKNSPSYLLPPFLLKVPRKGPDNVRDCCSVYVLLWESKALRR